MELVIVLFSGAALLVAPFALWVHVRRSRWRRPQEAVALAWVAILVAEVVCVAVLGAMYPFGFPGREERAWRAAAVECERRYAAARTARDTVAVDYYTHGGDTSLFVPICHTFRQEHLTSPAR